MKEYYFKFVVADSVEHHFDSYFKAAKKAKQLDEKVSLCIFSRKNRYNEIYDEVIVADETNIEEAKELLIKSFIRLTI